MTSPPLTTANPSTAPSANTSPLAMGAVSEGRSTFAFSNSRSVPSTAMHMPQLSNLPQKLPPMIPSISSMTMTTACDSQQTVAQSMPSSPNFRSATMLHPAHAHQGMARNQSSISNHPFFASDVSSVRHNLQPHGVHPVYGSTTAPQSLQTTPMMQPNREYTLNDKFELPPIAFNNDGSSTATTTPYLSQTHV
ncbi:hypothetical protein IWW38_004129 [Coemansia aciculifera]|uniref:Uncharacterized protein n=1 Tax=Coemansia aciculifera TaxID=417176 RepID=A0ACC1LZ86_9FUNG|nr:hypothetical protein IWW38_004129 [Coemansia aciculifera]